MKMKLKNSICHLVLLIFIGFTLISCGNISIIIKPNNNVFYIDSYDYQIVENESSVSNELSYSLSFDIGLSIPEGAYNREITVNIEGKKEFRFTIDYCNTENIALAPSIEKYPMAVLYYTIPMNADSIKVTVKLKLSTIDLIDDINRFIAISCYSDSDSEFIDNHSFMDNSGCFKMSYSSDTGIFYEYNEFSESYMVVSVISNSKTLVIPTSRDGHPVTQIASNAFDAVTNIEELILPSTFTSLPKGLLSNMTNLKTLAIPFVGENRDGTGDTHFGYLFGGNSYKDHLKCIPSSLKEVNVTGGTSIGSSAFEDCTSIESITISDCITSIGSRAFRNCKNIIKATIPAIAIHFIPKTNLQEVIITSGDIIEDNAFSYNENLTRVIIGDSIKSIESFAFSHCDKLENLTIGAGVTNIANDAFSNCVNIKNVYYVGTLENWNALKIGNSNSELTSAKRYYYSENKPVDNGNYWHYVNEVVTKW